MDKETGVPLLVDGKEVVTETTFTPETPSGKAEITFTFNFTSQPGKTIVVFETLECAGKEIAAHADINDAAQSVGVRLSPKEAAQRPGRTGCCLCYWWLPLARKQARRGLLCGNGQRIRSHGASNSL